MRWMHVAPQKVDVEAFDRFGIVEVAPAGDKEEDAQGRQWEQRVEVMRDTIIYFRNNPSVLSENSRIQRRICCKSWT